MSLTIEKALLMPEASPPTFAAIDRVLKLLCEYNGEPIIAGQHPIHHAVVDLESECDYRPDRNQNFLYSPGKMFWFRMLWASREGSPTYLPESTASDRYNGLLSNEADDQVAIYWSRQLIDELNRWKRLIRDHGK